FTLEVDAHDPLSTHDDDALPVLFRRPKRESVSRNGAQQVTLGEMRPFVGHLLLRADQGDQAVEVAVDQARGDRITGRSGADDYGFDCLSSSRSFRSDQPRKPPRTITANAYAGTR